MTRFMAQIALAALLLVTNTSYTKPPTPTNELFNHDVELTEIRENLNSARKDLDSAREVIKDKSKLKKILKRNRKLK